MTDDTATTADVEIIELEQVLLGTKPYVLIEAFMGDGGDDDLRLSIRYGGGAEDATTLPAMMLSEVQGDNNPITRAIAMTLVEDERKPEGPRGTVVDTLTLFAKTFGVDMPSAGLVENVKRALYPVPPT